VSRIAVPDKEIALDLTGQNDIDSLLSEAKSIGIRTVVSRTGFTVSRALDGLTTIEASEEGKAGDGRALWLQVETGKDVERAIEAAEMGHDLVIVQCNNWKIIPLENLIAEFRRRNRRIYAFMKERSDIELAFGILEKGVDGIVIPPDSLGAVKELMRSIGNTRVFELFPATVTKIVDVGLGERVCVDTTSQLSLGEGMLVGSIGSFFFLVHGETVPSAFIPTRPFRVNAGAIHSYILGQDGKTRYLSELRASDRVEVVSFHGVSRPVTVGRVKIERRPLLMIAADANGQEGTAMLQKAETIRLVKADGTTVAVTDLREGDKVLVHLGGGAGRHFGGEVDEFIIER
jgi:3-dehydroquinate synthase II